jgi:Spy/CpxP family protein refolding chaperone
MHPFHRLRHRLRQCAPRAVTICHGFGAWRGHGPGRRAWESQTEEMDDDFGAGGFGVRRPLRFLAHKLALDDRQVAELARILDELKTERAQAEVDRRRTLSAFADALTGDAFDAAKAGEGGDLRVKTAERVRAAVLKALREIHALLNPEQRSRLAYLIRTGTLAV